MSSSHHECLTTLTYSQDVTKVFDAVILYLQLIAVCCKRCVKTYLKRRHMVDMRVYLLYQSLELQVRVSVCTEPLTRSKEQLGSGKQYKPANYSVYILKYGARPKKLVRNREQR